MNQYRTAVIGLGNIGFQFDLDSKRKGTWSHVSAYNLYDKTKLVGATELDSNKVTLFKTKYPNIPVFSTVDELMGKIPVDIVSICTPTVSHYNILKTLLNHPLKAVFCEKPLASNINEAKEMVRLCEKHNVVLAVNHTRRWDNNYLLTRDIVTGGKIGDIKAVSAIYPGQVFNIGTHLFDIIRMITGLEVSSVSGCSHNIDSNDPDVWGWMMLRGKTPCTIISTGKREDLIFEIDIIGTEGRVRILENGEQIELFTFKESQRYSGYRELFKIPVEPVPQKDRFLEAIKDVVDVIEGVKKEPNCSGKDGFASLSLSFSMLDSAKRDGKPVEVFS